MSICTADYLLAVFLYFQVWPVYLCPFSTGVVDIFTFHVEREFVCMLGRSTYSNT